MPDCDGYFPEDPDYASQICFSHSHSSSRAEAPECSETQAVTVCFGAVAFLVCGTFALSEVLSGRPASPEFIVGIIGGGGLACLMVPKNGS